MPAKPSTARRAGWNALQSDGSKAVSASEAKQSSRAVGRRLVSGDGVAASVVAVLKAMRLDRFVHRHDDQGRAMSSSPSRHSLAKKRSP